MLEKTFFARRAVHFICFAFLLLAFDQASADCASPTGIAGQLQWIAASSAVKYCNGSAWVTLNSASIGTCSTVGQISYVSSELVYCNGTNWLRTAPTTNYGACAAGSAGYFYYDSGGTYYWYCNGSNWRRMGP